MKDDGFVLGAKHSSHLEDAMRRDGKWDNGLTHLLPRGSNLTRIRKMLQGDATIELKKVIVSPKTDMEPVGKVFPLWSTFHRQVDVNQLDFEPHKYRDLAQSFKGNHMVSFSAHSVLCNPQHRGLGWAPVKDFFIENLNIAGVGVLDFLLNNQKYIPFDWRESDERVNIGYPILFPGTAIYVSEHEAPCDIKSFDQIPEVIIQGMRFSNTEGDWERTHVVLKPGKSFPNGYFFVINN